MHDDASKFHSAREKFNAEKLIVAEAAEQTETTEKPAPTAPAAKPKPSRKASKR